MKYKVTFGIHILYHSPKFYDLFGFDDSPEYVYFIILVKSIWDKISDPIKKTNKQTNKQTKQTKQTNKQTI